MFKNCIAGLAVLTLAAPALAQTAPNATRTVSASVEVGARADGQAGRWACAATSGLEIMEVSDDVLTERVAYVLVERVNGQTVSSQRLSQADVAAFQRLGCPSSGEAFAAIG